MTDARYATQSAGNPVMPDRHTIPIFFIDRVCVSSEREHASSLDFSFVHFARQHSSGRRVKRSNHKYQIKIYDYLHQWPTKTIVAQWVRNKIIQCYYQMKMDSLACDTIINENDKKYWTVLGAAHRRPPSTMAATRFARKINLLKLTWAKNAIPSLDWTRQDIWLIESCVNCV